MIKIPKNMLSGSKCSNLWYLSIPKNACSSVKMSIFRENFGFSFPEISHPWRYGALIHIHQLYRTRRLTNSDKQTLKKNGGRLFVIIRNPLDRFVSGYVEKILLNVKSHKNFDNLAKLENIEKQLLTDEYESRIVRDHFRPQSFWLGEGGDVSYALCTLDNITEWLNLSVESNKTQIENTTLIEMKNEAKEFMSHSTVFAKTFEVDMHLYDIARNKKEYIKHG